MEHDHHQPRARQSQWLLWSFPCWGKSVKLSRSYIVECLEQIGPVKSFLRLVMVMIFITRDNLHIRGGLDQSSLQCVGECSAEESITHLFFECPMFFRCLVWYMSMAWDIICFTKRGTSAS